MGHILETAMKKKIRRVPSTSRRFHPQSILTKRRLSFGFQKKFDVLLSLQSLLGEDAHGATDGAFFAFAFGAAAAAALAFGILSVAAACSGCKAAAGRRRSKTLDEVGNGATVTASNLSGDWKQKTKVTKIRTSTAG